MKPLYESKYAFALLILTVLTVRAIPENIDPDNDNSQYAYGENVGWANFEPSHEPGAHVSSDKITGYVWAENIGWISLSCENTASCATVNYRVANDGAGNLSGYAWGENVGWISFSCENTGSCGTLDYGVTIDNQGNFDGWAYAQNIGWIHFQAAAPVPYKVKTAWVYCLCMGDMTADAWLSPGDVSGLVSTLLPYKTSYYWTLAPAGSCGDMTNDGWLSPADVSSLVSTLLPHKSNYYWVPCE